MPRLENLYLQDVTAIVIAVSTFIINIRTKSIISSKIYQKFITKIYNFHDRDMVVFYNPGQSFQIFLID